MAMFKAWCPENGEAEDDAIEVDAFDFRGAAEVYAEDHWTSADPFNEITVRVASIEADRAWDVEVAVRPEPVFSAVRDVAVETEDD
jgi:hypothetical protein